MSNISSIQSLYNNSQLYGMDYSSSRDVASAQSRSASSLQKSAYGQSGLSSLSSVLSEVMSGLGLNSNDSITFRDIVKYRDTLSDQFDSKMREDLEKLAGSDAFESKLKKAIKDASGSAEFDVKLKADLRKLAGGDEFDEKLKADLQALGVSDDAVYRLETDKKGGVKVVSDYETKAIVEKYFQDNPDMAEKFTKIDSISQNFKLETGKDGKIKVTSDNSDKAVIEQYFEDHPEMASQFKDIQNLSGAFSLKAGQNGKVEVLSDSPETKAAVEKFLADNPELANEFKDIKSVGDFKLASDGNGGIQVIAGDKNTKALVEQYLKDNPDMVSRFQKIESLTNMEEARKTQKVDINAVRNRIQIESMTTWFMNTGQGVSSIMDFSGGDTSLLAGLNKMV